MKRAIQADNQICYVYQKFQWVIAARMRANNPEYGTSDTRAQLKLKDTETDA